MYLSPEQWTALQPDVKREDFPHKQHNYSPHAHAHTSGVCGPAGQSEASRSTFSVNGCLGWEKDSPCGWRGGSSCFGLRVDSGRCFIWSGATAFVPLNEFAAGSLNFMSQWEIDDDFFFLRGGSVSDLCIYKVICLFFSCSQFSFNLQFYDPFASKKWSHLIRTYTNLNTFHRK